MGFPGGSAVKNLSASARDTGSIPPREGNSNPTPVFLPGKSHEQRSLAVTVHGVEKELDLI